MRFHRHIPDDPYDKYHNEVSYWKHNYTKRKNLENIKRFGNDIYRYSAVVGAIILFPVENG